MTNALPLWAENLAVFDTETTGIDTSQARVVSCSVALLSGNGEVSERYDWLIDPGIEIPEAAANVHGITTEVAREERCRSFSWCHTDRGTNAPDDRPRVPYRCIQRPV